MHDYRMDRNCTVPPLLFLQVVSCYGVKHMAEVEKLKLLVVELIHLVLLVHRSPLISLTNLI